LIVKIVDVKIFLQHCATLLIMLERVT